MVNKPPNFHSPQSMENLSGSKCPNAFRAPLSRCL